MFCRRIISSLLLLQEAKQPSINTKRNNFINLIVANWALASDRVEGAMRERNLGIAGPLTEGLIQVHRQNTRPGNQVQGE